MNDLTKAFGTLYHPQKAFLIYQQDSTERKIYIESYDIDRNGNPINAHPLSVTESTALAKALRTNESKQNAFLKPAGLLPKNLLYFNPGYGGYAVWFTPKQYVKLLFSADLGISCGMSNIPALIWKATKDGIGVYAILNEDEINSDTDLYHAPFFNTYNDGKVCMGNVAVNIPKNCGLEDFISQWQTAFFNSYFSHMMQNHNPVKGNLVQLWKNLVGTGKAFPVKSLNPLNRKLKHLIK